MKPCFNLRAERTILDCIHELQKITGPNNLILPAPDDSGLEALAVIGVPLAA